MDGIKSISRKEYINNIKMPKCKTNKSTVLNVRISKEEEKYIKSEAKRLGVNVTQWARSRLFYD